MIIIFLIWQFYILPCIASLIWFNTYKNKFINTVKELSINEEIVGKSYLYERHIEKLNSYKYAFIPFLNIYFWSTLCLFTEGLRLDLFDAREREIKSNLSIIKGLNRNDANIELLDEVESYLNYGYQDEYYNSVMDGFLFLMNSSYKSFKSICVKDKLTPNDRADILTDANECIDDFLRLFKEITEKHLSPSTAGIEINNYINLSSDKLNSKLYN